MKYCLRIVCFFSVLSVCFIAFGYGQKTKIAVYHFTYSPDVNNTAHTAAVVQRIESTFFNAKRFEVVHSTSFPPIPPPAATTEITLEKAVQMAKQSGADYMIVGHLTSIPNKATEVEPVSVLSFAIKLLDVKQGQIIANETFNSPKNLIDFSTGGDEDANLNKALENIEKELKDFMNVQFPVHYSIVKAEKGGSKITTLQIMAGKNNGVQVGDRFFIKENKTAIKSGRKIEVNETIAEVELSEVLGDDAAQCTVLETPFGPPAKRLEGAKALKLKMEENAQLAAWPKIGKEKK